MFSSDELAVIGQPIYLMIAGTVTAVIIALFLLSLHTMMADSQRHIVDHEIDKILTQSATMFEYADEGAFVTLHVDFPSSLRFIVFGGLPHNSTQRPGDLRLNESVSNNYYYVMIDGSIHIGHSNARFSSQNCTQVAILGPGSFEITLELCIEGDKTYVKMYQR